MKHNPEFVSIGIAAAYIFDQIATFKFLYIHLNTFLVLLFFLHQREPRKSVKSLILLMYRNHSRPPRYLSLYVGAGTSGCTGS